MHSLSFIVVEESTILARIHVIHDRDEELFVELEVVWELGQQLICGVHELQENRRTFTGLEECLMNMT